ncbi:unnamed protein product [Ectocarpus fasciculatus]
MTGAAPRASARAATCRGFPAGGVFVSTKGTEMCLELVRTCAFAALLSDEVFADVDLETVQATDHTTRYGDFPQTTGTRTRRRPAGKERPHETRRPKAASRRQ